ncbi:hypothetical protein [Sinobacterium caligoides]|nr:hypothetical protein [Sinobacterium caligoides]
MDLLHNQQQYTKPSYNKPSSITSKAGWTSLSSAAVGSVMLQGKA